MTTTGTEYGYDMREHSRMIAAESYVPYNDDADANDFERRREAMVSFDDVRVTARVPMTWRSAVDRDTKGWGAGLPLRTRETYAESTQAGPVTTYRLNDDGTRTLVETRKARTVRRDGRLARQATYDSNADRQRAYRERKRAALVEASKANPASDLNDVR